MKKQLESNLAYIKDSQLDLTDFNTIERNLKYHLRFELGDPFENGTEERVEQSTNRATELFENHIQDSVVATSGEAELPNLFSKMTCASILGLLVSAQRVNDRLMKKTLNGLI